jgi:exopolyphosphatase
MGLSVETLLFIDEVDLDELFSRGRLEMVLVDHNRLARSQEHLSRSIVDIVDHHEPEDLYPWVEDRLIEQVSGKCRFHPHLNCLTPFRKGYLKARL